MRSPQQSIFTTPTGIKGAGGESFNTEGNSSDQEIEDGERTTIDNNLNIGDIPPNNPEYEEYNDGYDRSNPYEDQVEDQAPQNSIFQMPQEPLATPEEDLEPTQQNPDGELPEEEISNKFVPSIPKTRHNHNPDKKPKSPAETNEIENINQNTLSPEEEDLFFNNNASPKIIDINNEKEQKRAERQSARKSKASAGTGTPKLDTARGAVKNIRRVLTGLLALTAFVGIALIIVGAVFFPPLLPIGIGMLAAGGIGAPVSMVIGKIIQSSLSKARKKSRKKAASRGQETEQQNKTKDGVGQTNKAKPKNTVNRNAPTKQQTSSSPSTTSRPEHLLTKKFPPRQVTNAQFPQNNRVQTKPTAKMPSQAPRTASSFASKFPTRQATGAQTPQNNAGEKSPISWRERLSKQNTSAQRSTTR
jgi:hypothetical protein